MIIVIKWLKEGLLTIFFIEVSNSYGYLCGIIFLTLGYKVNKSLSSSLSWSVNSIDDRCTYIFHITEYYDCILKCYFMEEKDEEGEQDIL